MILAAALTVAARSGKVVLQRTGRFLALKCRDEP
jgi:hypothetical protein